LIKYALRLIKLVDQARQSLCSADTGPVRRSPWGSAATHSDAHTGNRVGPGDADGDDRRQADPMLLADLARGRMRRKIPGTGAGVDRHFDAHHAQLAKSILRRLGFCSPWLAFVESLWPREPDEWRRPALCALRATSTPVYVRLHGPDGAHLYAGSYGDADLYWSADRIREWQRQHLGVLAYFNNDGYGHAVPNARRLGTLMNS
jgi:hypothetical protein